jgi:hypothetical protein
VGVLEIVSDYRHSESLEVNLRGQRSRYE